jgi:glucan biosynthesis protein C
MRWISLIVGIVFTLVGGALFAILGDQAFGTPLYLLLNAMATVIGWGWILAIFGFSLKRLNFRTPFLEYANEAVLPFYILHQTILLTVGYFVVTWPFIGIAKWAIIVAVSFLAIMVVYEFLVRRINIIRILFGMKPLPRPRPQVVEPMVASRG